MFRNISNRTFTFQKFCRIKNNNEYNYNVTGSPFKLKLIFSSSLSDGDRGEGGGGQWCCRPIERWRWWKFYKGNRIDNLNLS